MKTLLPSDSDLATAVTVTDTADSGQDWTAPDTLPAPALADTDCTVVPQITADEASADYRATYAKETLAEHGSPIAQIVLAATNPGDAARQIAEVRSLAERRLQRERRSVSGAVTVTAIPNL